MTASVSAEPVLRRVFLSYCSADRTEVLRLRHGLERMRQNVWADVEMSVGMVWWDEICEQIRGCSAMIVAVSPSLADSVASSAEREYARALGKPVLPVRIRPVRPELLPADLAQVQFVDYCDPTPEAAFELAAALSDLPAAPPLPDVLPPEPPIPGNYWYAVGEQVHAPVLSFDEQLSLVARLRDELRKPANHELVGTLLRSLQDRRDLFAAPAREIDELLRQLSEMPLIELAPDDPGGSTGPADPWSPSAAVTTPPRDWYPDPAGRHRVRWFDRDWTDWVSDGGPPFVDAL